MNFYRRPQPKLYVSRPNERSRRPVLLLLLAVLALVLLLTVAGRAQRAPRELNLYHAHKVGVSAVRITCDEGLKPYVVTDAATIQMLGRGGIIVACGQ